jgi:hypothetical protein
MARILLNYVLPLVAPALVFIVWTWARGAYIRSHGGQPPAIEDGPWFWLALAGGVLLLAVLAGSAMLTEGGRPGDTYVPPTVIDGKIVPGHHIR